MLESAPRKPLACLLFHDTRYFWSTTCGCRENGVSCEVFRTGSKPRHSNCCLPQTGKLWSRPFGRGGLAPELK